MCVCVWLVTMVTHDIPHPSSLTCRRKSRQWRVSQRQLNSWRESWRWVWLGYHGDTCSVMYSVHWYVTGCGEVDCHGAEDGEEH